jgi:hypothetical protein
MIEVQRHLIHLPGHDGQPPAEFGWNVDCQVSFDHGVKTAPLGGGHQALRTELRL